MCWFVFCAVAAVQVDGELKQKGTTSDMIFPVPKLVSFLSTGMTLEEGDIILTGTPAGVGPVVPGQVRATPAAACCCPSRLCLYCC